MPPLIVLFARAPQPGCAKTRLIPAVGADAAADLHACFVADLLDRLGELGRRGDLELHTDVATAAWNEIPVPRRLQAPGELGARLYAALSEALGAGRPQAMVVGSDAPTLPLDHLERLLDSSADVALGPCEDGGYYAICCRRIAPAMFAGVEWGGPAALQQTLSAARACGLTIETGPLWYDVDSPADL